MMNVLIIALVSFVVNIPLGWLRSNHKRFTIYWWLLVHASIPLVLSLRILLDTPTVYVTLFIPAAISGQLLGGLLWMLKRGKGIQ